MRRASRLSRAKYQTILKASARSWLIALWRILVVFLLFSLTRVLFYVFNLHLFPDIAPDHLIELMLGGLRFDAAAIAYTNALFLLLSFLPLLLRFSRPVRIARKWIYVATNAIALGMNCADIIYYRFTARRSTLSVLNEFKNESAGSIMKLFGQFFIDYWYVLIIWIGIIVILILLYGKDATINPKRRSTTRTHLLFLAQEIPVLLIMATISIAGIRGDLRHSTRPITISNAAKYANNVKEIGIVLNTPFSVYRTASKKILPRVNYYDNPETLNAQYNPIITPQPNDSARRYNIVVIIVESLSREFISSYNPERKANGYEGYTPFLDSLISESLTFRHSFANGHKSISAMPSALASIPMMVEPFVVTSYSTNRINGIATLLNHEGYRTAFFHGAPNGSMGFDAFAKTAGFQSYYGMNEYPNASKDFDDWWGIWDEPFLQYFAQSLNTMRQPFATALFTLSSHHPFHIPEQYKGKFPKGHRPLHQCVGYTDHALRQFFAYVKKTDWYQNTIFVITGDHTNQKYLPEYKTSVTDFAVPLIFHFGDGHLKGMRNEIAQQIDITPTLLGLIGNQQPYIAFGQDLLHRKDGQMAIGYTNGVYQLLQDSLALLYTDRPIGVYDWQRDSLLQNNLLGMDTAREHAMARKLQAIIQQYNTRMLDNQLTIEQP